MAILTGQISMRSILNTMGAGAVSNYPISTLNITAMGGSASVNNQAAAYSLCMPYEAGAVNSLGYNGVAAPGANWSSRTTNYRENAISDFRNAYSGKPVVSKVGSGWRAAGNASQVWIDVTGSGEGGGPFYFYITGASGTTTGWNSWSVGNPSKTWLITSTGYRAWFYIYIQDSKGCGNKTEFGVAIQYY
jgi:hypothetical protein